MNKEQQTRKEVEAILGNGVPLYRVSGYKFYTQEDIIEVFTKYLLTSRKSQPKVDVEGFGELLREILIKHTDNFIDRLPEFEKIVDETKEILPHL